jgi:hypothetical protein
MAGPTGKFNQDSTFPEQVFSGPAPEMNVGDTMDALRAHVKDVPKPADFENGTEFERRMMNVGCQYLATNYVASRERGEPFNQTETLARMPDNPNAVMEEIHALRTGKYAESGQPHKNPLDPDNSNTLHALDTVSAGLVRGDDPNRLSAYLHDKKISSLDAINYSELSTGIAVDNDVRQHMHENEKFLQKNHPYPGQPDIGGSADPVPAAATQIPIQKTAKLSANPG